MARVDRVALAGALSLLLGACSFAPTYTLQPVRTASDFQGAGPWRQAAPADVLPRGAWWEVFGNPELNELEQRVGKSNASLAAALAHFDQQQALLSQTRAGLFPEIDASGSATRNKQSRHRPLRGSSQPDHYDANTLGLGMAYELDLWGRVRNLVKAGEAETAAAAADLESVRLGLTAALASDYFHLRQIDAESQLLSDTVEAYGKALQLTKVRQEGGIASGLDVDRAETQLDVVQAQLEDLVARRALYEHSIAVLTGESPSSFHLSPVVMNLTPPKIPVGLPSDLLQRRPDVAAAERRAAEANALIGVARAAYFPQISLTGIIGLQNASEANLLTEPNTFWTLGPSFSLPIFDAGKVSARVRQSHALFDERSAQYRAAVLNAFREVEDNLTLLTQYEKESVREQAAVDAAGRAADIAMARYREGVVSYLEVVTAQAAQLQVERDNLALASRRLDASIGLVRALGGGWQSDDVRTASR
ncbi:MAG TPA: efflux transporter outer membrane subunit [Moraxellaceae bacterium]|nr:efflux transporter outer membrane subunit [Moraxellaceae bacterium]